MKVERASVKVMLSYDYCHFEVVLGTNEEEELTDRDVNELRKRAQRLADEAKRQYQVAKTVERKRAADLYERATLENEVQIILENVPEAERSEDEIAKIKSLEDQRHEESYNYDDDPEWLA